MTFLVQQTLIYAVPLMIVALAGVFAERSGIINLALEGIMIFGAFIGVLFVRTMQGSEVFAAAKAAGDYATLQGLESAKEAGDNYPERQYMLMDGVFTQVGSFLG